MSQNIVPEDPKSCTANVQVDNNESRLSQPPTITSSASELSCSKASLRAAMRSFPDFPVPGVKFLDYLPLFLSHDLHSTLIRAMELQVLAFTNNHLPDVIVALDARGFLIGPTLALRLGAGFVPVRKRNKLPGPTVTASYEKEYGTDHFEMQVDAITNGQSVLIVDDVIATGGSAQAAGNLVEQLGGNIQGYLFITQVDGLNGRDRLKSPSICLLDN